MSQPWVGMMDGVAARRAECTARLSAASLNDDASRLARRIRRVQVHPDLVRAPHGAAGARRRPGRDRRSADAGGLHLRIDRIEVGEDSDAGVALGDAGEGVGETCEAAVQLAELLRQPRILLLEPGRLARDPSVRDDRHVAQRSSADHARQHRAADRPP